MGPWGQHYERTENVVGTVRRVAPLPGPLPVPVCGRNCLSRTFAICQRSGPRKSFDNDPRLGYDYDECDARVVLNRMSVKDGLITLPDGMNYRLLVLPQTGQMTPRLLRKIKELAQAGATIVGTPPQKSPSLSGFPACDQEVRELAGQIWGTGDAAQAAERRLGRAACSGNASRRRFSVRREIAGFRQRRAAALHSLPHGRRAYLFRRKPQFAQCHHHRYIPGHGKEPESRWPDTGQAGASRLPGKRRADQRGDGAGAQWFGVRDLPQSPWKSQLR